MAANRVADLTVDELRALIRETVREVLEEISDEQDDEGLEFKPATAKRLEKFLTEEPDGEAVDDLLSELGLDE